MILFIALFLLAIYYITTRNHDYWKKRNVKHIRPIPLFGNHLRNTLGLRNITETTKEYYNRYPDEKVVGYFKGTTPELIIRDPQIARHILTVDFPYFYRRGIGRNVNIEPLMANLLHSEGDTWKLLRKDMTPVFTAAKLKSMFPIVVKCADKMQDAIEAILKGRGNCDARDLMSRFICEVIGLYALSIETKNFNEPSYLQELGKICFDKSFKSFILLELLQLFPKIKDVFYIGDPKVEVSFNKTIKNIITERNGKATGKNDYLDYLLKSKEKGSIKVNSIEKHNSDGTPVTVEMEMDMKYIIGQMFIFFLAGYETSSSTASCTLYNLALYPDIQRQIQEEIDQVLMKYNKRLTYEAIYEMPLLEMAVKESLRMFPPAGFLTRVCTRHYAIPGLDVTIDPGVIVTIPVQAMQMDEMNFDQPREFRPERFADKYNKRLSFCYLPFGEGPRKCVGERLAYILYMSGLAAILQNFSVTPAEKKQNKIKHSRRINVVQVIEGGLPIKLTRR